ncbi:hypothetical protein AXG93_2550s1120 [Marchantia polymorpha subsp. ruderalis]|uniref:Uncharacterized protein n=1 Tax=Marchantia polymorpha subsp. ruderalis TaxID=1480154 RepID=A0A176VP74_MARPO|nr:hypothetical protein AXG93_2550s1120 [Marchantia polymorpha subsp. ruderalis]
MRKSCTVEITAVLMTRRKRSRDKDEEVTVARGTRLFLRRGRVLVLTQSCSYAFEPGVFYKAVVLDIGAHVQSPTIRLVVFDRADLQFSLFSAVRANGTVLTAGHMAGPASPSVDGMS